MKIISDSGDARELVQLVPLAIANLIVGLVLQVFVAARVGLNADVLFAAQAPYLVVSAVAASLFNNVLLPRLVGLEAGVRGRSLRDSMPKVCATLGLVCAATGGLTEVLAPLLVAQRIEGHAAFTPALILFGVGCLATCVSTCLATQALAAENPRGPEASQLASGVVALVLSAPLVDAFGIIGGVLTLVLRPALAALIQCGSLRRGFPAPDADHVDPKSTRGLFARCGRLIPTYIVLKLSPLVDRTLLGHADPAMLTFYAITVQLIGAALGLFEKTATRRLLMRLAGAAAIGRELSTEYRRWIRRCIAVGAAIFAASSAITALWLWVHAFHMSDLPADWDYPNDLVVWFLCFVALQLVLGALAQITSAPMYAADHLKSLSVLALISSAISILARVAGFAVLGVPGLLAGVVIYSLLNGVLFHRANLRGLAQ
jgi:hypothetical protein